MVREREQQAGLLEDQAGQPAHERVPEPDRAAVVAHHPQPEPDLAERAAAGGPLHDDRVAGHDEHRLRDQQRGERGRVGAAGRGRVDQDAGSAARPNWSGGVDRGGDRRATRSRPGAARGAPPHRRSSAVVRLHPHTVDPWTTTLPAPWTSTPSSPQHDGEWRRLEMLASRRRLMAPRRTNWSRCTGRWPPTCRWSSRARPNRRSPRGCRACSPGAGPPRSGRRTVRGWAALARGRTVDFPVTVYRTWRWSVGRGGGQPRRRRRR